MFFFPAVCGEVFNQHISKVFPHATNSVQVSHRLPSFPQLLLSAHSAIIQFLLLKNVTTIPLSNYQKCSHWSKSANETL